VVQVLTDVAHLDMARAVADAAYRHGARFVEFDLRDAVLQRSLIVDGPARAYVPAWRDASTYGLDDVEGARIQINGHTAAGLLAGLDPVRVDRAQAPRSAAWREVEYRVNNTIIPGPDLEWAQALRPDLEPDPALDQLWDEIAIACRLDDPDPPQAWHRRFALLTKRAEWLTSLGLTALALRGPDTDLTVGLLPSTRWEPPTHRNQRGISHAWNIPSEELYTSPDPGRVEGCVRLTRPAVISGVEISDVSLTFTDGVLTHVTGGPGVERLRAFTDGSARSRSSTAKAPSRRSLTHSKSTCSTRTPPAISRSASATPNWSERTNGTASTAAAIISTSRSAQTTSRSAVSRPAATPYRYYTTGGGSATNADLTTISRSPTPTMRSCRPPPQLASLVRVRGSAPARTAPSLLPCRRRGALASDCCSWLPLPATGSAARAPRLRGWGSVSGMRRWPFAFQTREAGHRRDRCSLTFGVQRRVAWKVHILFCAAGVQSAS
jgi:leucyl aminopeptidase (aminopeptidase T)